MLRKFEDLKEGTPDHTMAIVKRELQKEYIKSDRKIDSQNPMGAYDMGQLDAYGTCLGVLSEMLDEDTLGEITFDESKS